MKKKEHRKEERIKDCKEKERRKWRICKTGVEMQ
jgi:hypothetical protein